MLVENRKKHITDLLQVRDSVTTAELIQYFSVSAETVRRDLLEMEEENLLRRVHGGAVRVSEMKPFSHLKHRNQENIEKKQALAKAAAEFVHENDFIGIDMGSTANYFAQAVRERCSRLTVVTHALDVFEILRDQKNINLILCGGYYMARENSFYGALTLDILDRLHLSKAFIFPSAISLDAGITDHQQELYLVQRKIVDISDQIFVLADSTKFGKKALLKLDDVRPDYTYVTDSALDDAEYKKYTEQHIKLYKGELQL